MSLAGRHSTARRGLSKAGNVAEFGVIGPSRELAPTGFQMNGRDAQESPRQAQNATQSNKAHGQFPMKAGGRIDEEF